MMVYACYSIYTLLKRKMSITVSNRYYIITILCDPRLGLASFSWRIKSALESLGHTVFVFTPRMFQGLFGDDPGSSGHVAKSSSLRRFFERQNVDMVMQLDGVRFDDGGELVRQCGATLVDIDPFGSVSVVGDDAKCARGINPVPDKAFVESVLANDIMFKPGVLTLQPINGLRGDVLRMVGDTLAACGHDVKVRCCRGDGGGADEAAFASAIATAENRLGDVADFVGGDPAKNDAFYALKTPGFVLLFSDDVDDLAQCDFQIGEAIASGSKVLCYGRGYDGYWADHVTCVDDIATLCEEAKSALALAEKPSGGDGLQQPAGEANRGVAGGEPSLDDELSAMIESLEPLLSAGIADAGGSEADASSSCIQPRRGSALPRSVVCLLGYVGWGNFGDEYILSVIDERIRSIGGCSVVAFSQRHEDVVVNRGIYAIPIDDCCAVEQSISYSTCLLVIAGLLFDQGTRWSMGKGQLLSSPLATDIPAIAGMSALASMGNLQMVAYGIGVGPLQLHDSRDLVSLMGRLGVLFFARDEESAQLVMDSGVDPNQVDAYADSAFLGKDCESAFFDEWMAERVGSGELPPDGGKKLVAISLREYENLPSGFEPMFADSLADILKGDGSLVAVFSILDAGDLPMAERIMGGITDEDVLKRVLVYNPGSDVDATCALLQASYCAISMRYHCALIMNRMGKPVVGIDYLPKVASLFSQMGCSELLLGTDVDSGQLVKTFRLMLEGYDRFASTISENVRKCTELSERAFARLAEMIEGRRGEKSHMTLPAEVYPYNESTYQLIQGDKAAMAANLEQENARLESVASSLRRQIDETLGSSTWKAGRLLTFVPRRLKGLLHGSQAGAADAPAGEAGPEEPREAHAAAGSEGASGSVGVRVGSGEGAAQDAAAGEQAMVSVVIPAHDAADHIAEALDSILSQTHGNLEVICVDDASTDETSAIIGEYEQRDSRVRAIRIPVNAGPGAARNMGIDAARGDYLYCMDSDDFCDASLLANMVDAFESTGADMVCLAHNEFDDGTGSARRAEWSTDSLAFPRVATDGVCSWRDNPDMVFHAVQNFPWNKALRMDYVRSNHIRFQEDVRLTEDLMYSAKAVLGTDRIAFVDEPLVYHRVGTGTNVMSAKDKHPVDFLTAFLTLKEYLEAEGVYDELKVAFSNWAALACIDNLFTLKTYDGYRQAFEALTSHGMKDLGLYDLPMDEYFSDDCRAIVGALQVRGPEDAAEYAHTNFVVHRDLAGRLSQQLAQASKKTAGHDAGEASASGCDQGQGEAATDSPKEA